MTNAIPRPVGSTARPTWRAVALHNAGGFAPNPDNKYGFAEGAPARAKRLRSRG